jgi:hypothetical protein
MMPSFRQREGLALTAASGPASHPQDDGIRGGGAARLKEPVEVVLGGCRDGEVAGRLRYGVAQALDGLGREESAAHCVGGGPDRRVEGG